MEAGPHVTHELATSKLASTIDLIVHLNLTTERSADGFRRHRSVHEVIAVAPGERETGYAITHLFSPDGSGMARPSILPEEYRSLASDGFDLAGFLSEQQVVS